MYNLFLFFIKYSSTLFFILLEALCFYFIFTANSYQSSLFLNSSNYLVGNFYKHSSRIDEFISLKQDNQALLQANGELKNTISELENVIFELTKDSLKINSFFNREHLKNDYIVARVIKKSVNKPFNYITINKGLKDSVEIGMGVISPEGIVGEVTAVTENFALILPIINIHSHYDSKLKGSNIFESRSLTWDSQDHNYVYMKEFPGYGDVKIGDTIVTSGYSKTFPADIIVGTINDISLNKNTNNFDLKIKIGTNFTSLNNVMVLKMDYVKELNELEKSN